MAHSDWQKLICTQGLSTLKPSLWSGRLFSGSWKEGIGGVVDVVEPATGEIFDSVGIAGPADITIASRSALTMQKAWVALSPRERADWLRQAAIIMQGEFDALTTLVMRETGGVRIKSEHEVREAINLLHLASSMVLQPSGVVLPRHKSTLGYSRKLPYGIVGVITSYSFPIIQSMRVVAPALAAGNAVILMPDLNTPISGGFVMARAFELAGIPAGLLHVLPGGKASIKALCEDSYIRMISFSGSNVEGQKIARLAGDCHKKISLEVAGGSTIIVLDDVNIDLVGSNVAWAAYFHQGQTSSSATRVFVHKSIEKKLISKVISKINSLEMGNPVCSGVQIGPMINEEQVSTTHALVEAA